MPNLNKVMLMGNLTRDPELKYTQSGSAICDIGLAVNRRWKGKDGKATDETTFISVTFWGKPGETIAQHVKKGQPLYVEGRLTLNTWDDKATGAKRSKLFVTGEAFQFLSAKQDAAGDAGEVDELPF